MDRHDFKSAQPPAFVDTTRQSSEPPRKQPEPHYIYTAQAPEERHDRDAEKESLFASFIITIVLPLLGIVWVTLRLKYGFPF